MPQGAADSNKVDAQERIQRKLEVLKSYRTDGIPLGAFVPQSMNQFRAWEDKPKGIFRIGSPNTMSATSSPHNRELIEKVKSLLEAFAGDKQRSEDKISPLSVSRSQVGEVRRLKAHIDQIEDLNAKLVCDWHAANNELAFVKRSLSELKQSNSNLKSVVSELRAQIVAAGRGGIRSID